MKINSYSTDHIGPRIFCLLWAVVGLSIRPNLSRSPLYYFYKIPQAADLLPAQSAKAQGGNVFHVLVYPPQIQFQMAFLDTQLLLFFYVNSFIYNFTLWVYDVLSMMIDFIFKLIYQLIFVIDNVQTPHLLFNDMKLY